jgi:quinol monooxygenase YgiN
MIVLAAKFTGKPERKQDILRMVGVVTPLSRAESGCLTYAFYEQQPESNQFLFFEEWRDQAALDAHFKTQHFADFVGAIPELIEGAPHIRIYEVSQTRDM